MAENAPKNDVLRDATLRLDENSPNGTGVGRVEATDFNSATLTYSLVARGDSTFFAIDVATGEITVTDYCKFDFEVQTQFTLTVHARTTVIPP